MNLKKQMAFLLMILVTVLLPTGTFLAQEDARVRFIYAMPGPPIDVYVNDQLVAANLVPDGMSPYLDVAAGDLVISSTIASTANPAFPPQSLSVNAGAAVSITLSTTGNSLPQWEAVVDNAPPVQSDLPDEEPAASTDSDSEAADPVGEAAVPTPEAAISAGEAAVATALVNLHPGANLHLREYPSIYARSLGLAPSGTNLLVLGRRGPADQYRGEPIDLGDLESDPAAGLEWYADLEPADTWLHVDYLTPDGGIITAWVKALYLQVLDETGEKQRLANLEMVQQNQAGAAVGTSITSPQPAPRVVAHVYSLNPGVHLNIRTANHANSEIMGQAGSGIALTFLGLDENEEWAFIQYLPSDNVTITGWVSTQYVRLHLDGNPIEIQALKARDAALVPLIDAERRGSIVTVKGGEAPPAPTKDPFLGSIVGEVKLDPDAGLHLRQRPDVDAESLDIIPAGTRLIVDGFTENGEWYRTAFEGVGGWVSGQYLALSFNSRYIGEEELASRLTLFDNSGGQLPE